MIHKVIWIPEAISREGCDELLGSVDPRAWELAVIPRADGIASKEGAIRASSVQWLKPEHWFAEWFQGDIRHLNSTSFFFQLGEAENVQLTRYQVGEHYHWHQDMFYPPPGAHEVAAEDVQIRKLSAIIQLSDPATYHGGDILLQDTYGHILNGYERAETWRMRGSALVFPSTTFHCVTPIVCGERFAAVLWISGPVWR